MSQAIRRMENAAAGAKRDKWEAQANVTRIEATIKERRESLEKAERALIEAQSTADECAEAEAAILEAIETMKAREKRLRIYGTDPVTISEI
jgi:chromosome segregation ATPase